MRANIWKWKHVVVFGFLITLVVLLFKAEPTAQTVSALQVVDSGGRAIGVLVQTNLAARKIGSVWVSVWFFREGFAREGAYLYFTSTDCSSPAYVQEPGNVPRGAGAAGGRIYFAGNPIQTRTLSSYQLMDSDGVAGPCVTLADALSTPVGPARTFSIASFTAPFDVQ
jgi:hypothetical protein